MLSRATRSVLFCRVVLVLLFVSETLLELLLLLTSLRVLLLSALASLVFRVLVISRFRRSTLDLTCLSALFLGVCAYIWLERLAGCLARGLFLLKLKSLTLFLYGL